MHYYFTDEKDYKNHHIDFPYVQCMVLGLLMEVSNRIGIEIQNPKLTEDIATYLMEKPYHKDTNDNFGDIFATRNLKKLQNKINNYQCNPLPILKTIQNILSMERIKYNPHISKELVDSLNIYVNLFYLKK